MSTLELIFEGDIINDEGDDLVFFPFVIPKTNETIAPKDFKGNFNELLERIRSLSSSGKLKIIFTSYNPNMPFVMFRDIESEKSFSIAKLMPQSA